MSRRAHDVSPRHERPQIDEAGLIAARHADRLLLLARETGQARWQAYLAPLPDSLRDDSLVDLRRTALRARAAFGPKASLHDAFPDDLTVPFRDSIDRLLRLLSRAEAEPGD